MQIQQIFVKIKNLQKISHKNYIDITAEIKDKKTITLLAKKKYLQKNSKLIKIKINKLITLKLLIQVMKLKMNIRKTQLDLLKKNKYFRLR